MNGVGEVAARVVSECVLCVLCEKVCALVFACLLYVFNYILCIYEAHFNIVMCLCKCRCCLLPVCMFYESV